MGAPDVVVGGGNAALARRSGIEIRYSARVTGLIADDEGIKGVQVRYEGKTIRIGTNRVILAAGGFQRTRNGARAISARGGNSPRCAARASTPAT